MESKTHLIGSTQTAAKRSAAKTRPVLQQPNVPTVAGFSAGGLTGTTLKALSPDLRGGSGQTHM